MGQKNNIETIRKEMIDKACEWLYQHFDDDKYWHRDNIDSGDLIEDFKKAMTEQK